MKTDGVTIRRALLDESEAAAVLMWRVREQNLGSIPPQMHPLDDVRGWMRGVVFAEHEVWVAESDDALVGMLVLGRPDWIEHLYIDASHTGQGLGAQFVDLAKTELAGPVQLWTFQSNVGACRFYERHGFRAVQWTADGNEEKEPDVRFVFTP